MGRNNLTIAADVLSFRLNRHSLMMFKLCLFDFSICRDGGYSRPSIR